MTYSHAYNHKHKCTLCTSHDNTKLHSGVQMILKASDQNFSDISLNTYNICIWCGRDFTPFFKLFAVLVQPTSSYYYFKTTASVCVYVCIRPPGHYPVSHIKSALLYTGLREQKWPKFLSVSPVFNAVWTLCTIFPTVSHSAVQINCFRPEVILHSIAIQFLIQSQHTNIVHYKDQPINSV